VPFIHKLWIVAGMEHGNGVSILLPSGRDAGHRSLPVTLNHENCNSIQGRVTSSVSEVRLMNEYPASTMHNEETVPLSPDRMSYIHLEESDGEYSQGVLRQHSSPQLHSSLLGNPVCHPEQEHCATLSPTLVIAAAEPHMSLDPEKPCCDAAVGGHSSLTSANSHRSFSETLCKNNT